ncbi:MAG TPA: hypothetical protein VE863_13255 [Pyrinomonadaceae bacterium]|jgi:hypothetical protein|nr:hypothetical protein [Pyrinomonadaceae bacterium]
MAINATTTTATATIAIVCVFERLFRPVEVCREAGILLFPFRSGNQT